MQTETPRLPLARRAAQYVRMSTEHQQYSTENQGDKIKEYAARNDIEIVRTYADEAKAASISAAERGCKSFSPMCAQARPISD